MKLKIGDKVKIIKHIDEGVTFKIGSVGFITDYRKGLPYPYTVRRKDGSTGLFLEKELKQVGGKAGKL